MVKLYHILRSFRKNQSIALRRRCLLPLAAILLIVFGWSVVAAEMKVVESSTTRFEAIVNLNPSTTANLTTLDGQQLYYHNILLAVPENGTFIVDDFSIELEKPFIASDTLSYHHPVRAYEVTAPRLVRGVRMINIVIYPLQQDKFITQFRISGRFTDVSPSSKVVGVSNPDPVLAGAVANYPVFSEKSKTTYTGFSTADPVQTGPFTTMETWYKLSVGQTGVCRVNGSELQAAGLSLTGVTSSSLRMFNGGGEVLPFFNREPRPDFTEVSIEVYDGGDNNFDVDDYFLFYSEGVNRYKIEDSQLVYVEHAYDAENVYWLRVDNVTPGARISSRDGSSSAVHTVLDSTIAVYDKKVRLEQNSLLRMFRSGKIDDYYTWYWSTDDSVVMFLPLNGYVSGSDVNVTIGGKSLDTTGSGDDRGYFDFYVNGIKGSDKLCNLDSCTYTTTDLFNGNNRLVVYQMYNSIVAPYLNYVELELRSFLLPVNNELDLTISNGIGAVKYDIVDNLSTPVVYDVTNPQTPVKLTGWSRSSGTLSFYDSLMADSYSRYYVTNVTNTFAVSSIEESTPPDLYSLDGSTELYVIAPRFLTASLEGYREYHDFIGRNVSIVAFEDILDNFSYGLYDPTAIRDFLKYAYETSPGVLPQGVLLVGDANYDFLNRLGTDQPNYLPSFTNRYDNSSSDDNFVYFGEFGLVDSDTSYILTADRGYDMIVARWPVRTTEEVQAITQKIIQYDATTNFGIWRSTISFVADDEFGTFNNEDFHTVQTEALAANHVPDYINRDKIYLWEYPFVNNLKPAVNDRIVKGINDGSLLVNYVGHGNPDIWAHEAVFRRADDLPRLRNNDKLSLFFAASCAIGFFDDPYREGMAEELLAMSNGGAIGVISATRLVYSSDNAAFNRQVFDVLFADNSLSMCEAVYASKTIRQYVGSIPVPQANDRNYLFFGDPYQKLAVPSLDIAFDNAPDSLVALQPVTVSGRVVDSSGQAILDDGELVVNIMDSERNKSHRILNSSGVVTKTVNYSINGPSIFSGTATITNGTFDFTFIPPLDIGFGGEGAKISVYAKLSDLDGAGIVDSLPVSSVVSPSTDSVGPVITVQIKGRDNFAGGDYVLQSDVMEIILTDSVGINLAGGLGHGITVTLDGREEQIENLSDQFSYEQDSYITGKVEYPLAGISVGEHQLKIKAWDNANNSSVMNFPISVAGESRFELVDLLNYPNPMQDSTRFSFTLTEPADRVTLEIYTLSGKKIQTFTRYALVPGFYDDILWYGDDGDGDRVATQVYIYKATAYPQNGGGSIESFGKVIVIN